MACVPYRQKYAFVRLLTARSAGKGIVRTDLGRRPSACNLELQTPISANDLAQQRQRHRPPHIHAGVLCAVGDAPQRYA